MKYIVHKAIEFSALSAAWKKKNSVTDIDELASSRALQYKYDGCYACVKLLGPHQFEIVSRTGELVRSMAHVGARLLSLFQSELLKGSRFVVMGEAWASGVPQQTSSGWFRKHENVQRIQFAAFDVLSLDEFEAGLSATPFSERYATLLRYARGYTESDTVFVCPLFNPGTYGAPTEYAARLQAHGPRRAFDGAILRDLDAGWKAGSGSDGAIIKVKPRPSFDLLIVGFEEGEGKYQGTTGKVVLRFRDGTVIKAAGGTDAERAEWWAWQSKYRGRIGEVTCLERLPSGELREPVFKGIRFDKVDID